MNRRGFLGALIAAPIVGPSMVKESGTVRRLVNLIPDDYVPAMLIYPQHPVTLWPAVKEWWGREYDEDQGASRGVTDEVSATLVIDGALVPASPTYSMIVRR